MRKNRLLKAINIIIFTLIFCFLLFYINKLFIMKRPDGITSMQNYYAQNSNTIDLLILGSSHSGMNLDTEVLWSEYGISSYILWGSGQPFWNSYYFLIEALKTQEPKVVVLDVFAASKTFEYADEYRQITNTIGMKFSKNKIDSIMATAPKEKWLDLLLGLPLYHGRYDELTKDDFSHFPWNDNLINQKGSDVRYGTGEKELIDVTNINEINKIHPKEEEYLRKIIDTCKNEEIPLVLIKTPTAERSLEQPYYNDIQRIADEYEIPFYNFNLMDDETGFTANDYWTDNAHLNTNGTRKITKWLANTLEQDYAFTDHRGDELYESWDINANTLQNRYIRSISNIEDYFSELKRDDRVIFLIKNAAWEETEEYNILLQQMEQVGINIDEVKNGGGGGWLLTSTKDGEFLDKYEEGTMHSVFTFDNKTFELHFEGDPDVKISDSSVYTLDGPGLICIIYDLNTHNCVDVTTFLVSNNFQMVHY